MKLKEPSRKTRKMIVALTDWEFDQIKKKADKFAGGSLSLWVRYASIKLNPRPSDLEEEEEVCEDDDA